MPLKLQVPIFGDRHEPHIVPGVHDHRRLAIGVEEADWRAAD
jgi:hypothetical protein